MTSNLGRDRTARLASSASKLNTRAWRVSLAASLLVSCAPAALHAETSNAELQQEIKELRAEIREMKGIVGATRAETRRNSAKVAAVASRSPAYALPPPGAPYPVGAVPAFVTADKKLIFGGITITPGGFLAGESVFRSKTTNSDINSAWNNIPYGINPLSRTNEYRLTGRQSRAAVLAEGAITPTMLASGYAEVDFLGAGTTSNATDTNSYAPRIRQLYAGLDMNDYGLHFLAGQMWSLTTLNSKGITPRNEVPPPTIDGQFLPGFVFARQAGVRLTKDFGKKLWISIAAEEAQTTFATSTCSGSSLQNTAAAVSNDSSVVSALPTGVTSICAGTATGAGFSQYGQPYSLNHVPDVIGKVAYELTLGDRDIHFEATGLYKDLYNASYTTGSIGAVATHDVAGYGGGGGIIVPIIPKKLDFQSQVLLGRGIGRYGAGLLPDATFNPDGSLRPIGEVIGLAGFTFHATPAIDLYAYGGIEHENRANNGAVGYGLPNVANYGCNVTNAPAASCVANTENLWQITGGFWDKLYTGSFGEVRVGAQYSYTERDAFGSQAVVGAAAAAAAGMTAAQASGFFSPKTNEHTILTSIRYYPFQSTPVVAAPVVAKY